MAKSDKSLDNLQKKIDEARAEHEKTEKHPSSAHGDVSQAMRLGVELVAGVAVGSVAGYLLDRWLDTLPLFFIICFFLGAAGGFKNMLRDARRMAEDDSNKE